MSATALELPPVEIDPATAAPLVYSIQSAVQVSTLSMSRIYELIAEGRLTTTKIGKRRLIHADSLQRLLAEGC